MVFRKNTQRGKVGGGGGFTLVELVLVVAILALISTLVLTSLSEFRIARSMEATTETVFTAIETARTRTITGVNDSQYGIHLQADGLVLFVGTVYSSGASTNESFPVSENLEIDMASVSLAGGGNDIVFERITGQTDDYGTFVVQTPDGDHQETFEVLKTGIVKKR